AYSRGRVFAADLLDGVARGNVAFEHVVDAERRHRDDESRLRVLACLHVGDGALEGDRRHVDDLPEVERQDGGCERRQRAGNREPGGEEDSLQHDLLPGVETPLSEYEIVGHFLRECSSWRTTRL